MDIEGRVIEELPLQEGIAKSTGNPWKKKEWVFETFGQYPKKIKITLFGDRASNILLELGKSYLFSIDIESRKFQDRWYTDVNCFAAREIPAPQPMGMQNQFTGEPAAPAFGGGTAPAFGTAGTAPAFGAAPADSSDDLPF